MIICVFGSSGTEIGKNYIEKTEILGEKLAKKGHALMFGGGKHGLMGAAARGFTKGGGHITGVAPEFFKAGDVLYDKCDSFVWPESMRDRKKYMEDNSDAFIITPGGIGTYEEFFEVLTLKQLARQSKPIVIFNIDGFFDKMLEIIDENIKDGFIRAQTAELFKVTDSIDEVINIVETDSYDIDKIKFYD
ncbi:MAG: TIGR00730 family Rossman fold protein [Clostridia bacterium]|nr:TIGR00730 family Rossman fold protein [Clostridia bacterium]